MRMKRGIALGLAVVFLAGSAIADAPQTKPVHVDLYIYSMTATNFAAKNYGINTGYGVFASDSEAYVSAEYKLYETYPAADGWTGQRLVQVKVRRDLLKTVLDSPPN